MNEAIATDEASEIAPPWAQACIGAYPDTRSVGPGPGEGVLAESAGLTTITLTVRYPSKAARDAAFQTGMKDGMDQGFTRLDHVLGTMV